MTRRYTSGFDILGFDTDPTPGDPDFIMSQIVPTYQSIGDDAETAFNTLNGNAVESGAGQTMQALQNLIGTTFPPKLKTAADSYHSAASIYATYAQALTEAQNQLDRAMDQAMPVAALANSTVPPAPPNASADQVAAGQQQQQSVDQAKDQLTAATRLAQDAQDMRNQAGNTFNTDLDAVSSIPDLSWWQKFLNWFEHCPIFQIIVDVAIAIVSVFFPVVGLVLGAIAFAAFTAFNWAATGHPDWGAIVAGVLTLGFGFGVAFKAIDVAATFSKLASSAATAGKGGGSFFNLGSGKVIQGITSAVKSVTKVVPKSVVKVAGTAVGNFASDSVIGLGTNGTKDLIDHEQFTDQDVEAIFAGAAAGGAVAGGAKAAKIAFGFDPPPPVPPRGPEDNPLPPTPSGDPEGTPPPVPPRGPEDNPLPPTPSGDPEQMAPPVPPKDLGAVNKPLPLSPGTIGNAFNQAGRFGNDVANSGVQIAVGQALGNTTNVQQEPPGVQAGVDAVKSLPALADGPTIPTADTIRGVIEPLRGE